MTKHSGRSSWLRVVLLAYMAGYWTSTLLWSLQARVTSTMADCTSAWSPEIRSEASNQTTVRDSLMESLVESPMDTPMDTQEMERDSMEQEMEEFVAKNTNDANNNSTRRGFNPLWWKRHVPKLTRTWYPRTLDWCVPELDPPTPWLLGSGESARGILYMKLYKASSSTCEGIAWSVAHHVGRRLHANRTISIQTINADNTTTRTTTTPICMAYTRHEFGNQRSHARRDPPKSLLWSFVRNPPARDLSHIYHFEIGREGHDMNDSAIPFFIESKIKGRQFRYLVPKKGRAKLWPRADMRRNATEIIDYMKTGLLDNYDFLGIVERMSESLATMVLLWDLHPRDVIVLNSKRSGGYDDGGHLNTCTRIPKPPTPWSQTLQDYFANRHMLWNADILLYHVANATLDRTIDGLGRHKVQAVAQHIEMLQQIAQEACLEEAVFPCSANGTFQPEWAKFSCYVQDAGCGHACVDRVLEPYDDPKYWSWQQ